jgi:hypothetical protein
MRSGFCLVILLTFGGCGGKVAVVSVTPTADMAMPPVVAGQPATLLVPGAGMLVLYYADDTQAIYGAADGSVESIALTGGTPTMIAPYSDITRVFAGPQVATWQLTQAAPPGSAGAGWQSGTLTLWSAGGSRQLGRAVPEFALALSDDGTMAAYLDDMSADGTAADLYLAPTDGSAAPLLLLSHIALGAQLVFAGARLVIVHGAPGSSASACDLSVADFSGNVTALGSGIFTSDSVVISGDGTRVIAFSLDGKALRSYPLDGSPEVDLDSYMHSQQQGSSESRVAIPIGDDLLYYAESQFRRVPAAGGAVVKLVNGDALAGLSPDGHRFASLTFSTTSNNDGTLAVTSIDGVRLATVTGVAGAGRATLMSPTPAFSSDGRYVLYFTVAGNDPVPRGSATLHVLDWASGESQTIAPNVQYVVALLGDRLLTGEIEAGLSVVTADVVLHDASSAAPPLTLLHAPVYWRVTPDQTRIVYNTVTGPSPGLYLTTLPAP